MNLKKIICAIAMLISAHGAFAQGDVYERSQTYEWPTDPLVVKKLKQWQDLKFGVLIHWGLYAVPGIVESWSICDENWITRDTTKTYDQYKAWYWGLSNTFNPTKFDPEQWASTFDKAGMKYMLFTTKHHDGFCMYDSKQTNFTIAQHAFRDNPKRDVLRYVLQAFRNKGFMVGEYYSKPDWHSQDYWWDVYPIKRGRNVNYDIKQWPWRWNRFKNFVYAQTEELLRDYGKVDILWLDGGWVCKENGQDINMPRIASRARALQPGLIIVDRTIHGPYENYQTPERTIPEQQLNYPWESCIPLSNDWGWVKNPVWKSATKVINTLVEVVAKGGNLVLGVGPTADGRIQKEAACRLDSIGQWLKRYGKAIYNTVPTPYYQEGKLWFTADKNGRQRYAIYALSDGEEMPSTLSWHTNVPKSVMLLGVNKRLKMTKTNDGKVTVKLPEGMKAEPFALQLNL